MKTEILLEMDADVIEAAQALAVQRGISLAQLLGETLKNLFAAKLGYAATKARALARLEHGYDLGWTPPVEQAARPRLKDLLLAESPRVEIPVPARRSWRRPTPVGFE
jgi:hypothetical protein